MGAQSVEKEIQALRDSTIRHGKGPTIDLGSGNVFDFGAPEESVIELEDVAYGLGYESRFAGQCYSQHLRKRAFYAVAQHCVLGSYSHAVDEELVYEVAVQLGEETPHDEFLREYCLEFLWHEAAEFLFGDMVGPLKAMNPEYKKLEKRYEVIIADKFGIRRRNPLAMKKIDLRMLKTECRDLKRRVAERGDIFDSALEPFDFKIIPWTPDEAAQAFLDRHYELTIPGFGRSDLLKRLLAEAEISA